MASNKRQRAPSGDIWALVRRQYGVITRPQLLVAGLTRSAISHRLHDGRLHRIWDGVYSVGRPEVTREGRLIGATLATGPGTAVSGEPAAAHWGIRPAYDGPIEVTTPRHARGRQGIKIRRRSLPARDVTTHRGIPVTTPIRTLIDLAAALSATELERAVNEADRLDLVDPEGLRRALGNYAGVPGVRKLRKLVDRRTFSLTDSVLEQRFVPVARKAGLPKPLTRQRVNGFKVDFFWPELGLVVETDGLRYHRTPAQQAKDRERDQAHAAAGLLPLRFTHFQIRYEPDRVERILRDVVRRPLTPRRSRPPRTGPRRRR